MLIKTLSASIWLALLLPSPGQGQELTAEQRSRLYLDYRLSANVLLDNGDEFQLADFHLSNGDHRMMLLTGSDEPGYYMPLPFLQALLRVGRSRNHVRALLEGGATMDTSWYDPETQLIVGTLEDGSRWIGRFSDIREIRITVEYSPEEEQ